MKLALVNPDSVARGIDLLDSRLPNWVEKIDLETLNMEDPNHCIAAQIGKGNMFEGLDMLGIRDLSFPMESYGLDITHFAYDTDDIGAYRELQQLWVEEIQKRRSS